MFVHKRVLIPERIRRPPKKGWSWIDRQFVHEHAFKLSRDGVLLYFFLAAASDKDGLSYWGDSRIGALLRLSEKAVAEARYDLEHYDLIAYDPPVYQVLSLPLPRRSNEAKGTLALEEVLRKLTCHDSHTKPAVDPTPERRP